MARIEPLEESTFMTENDATQSDQSDNTATENVSTASTDSDSVQNQPSAAVTEKDHTTRNIIIAVLVFLLLLCCCCFLLLSAFVASGVLDPYLDQLNLGVGLVKQLPFM